MWKAGSVQISIILSYITIKGYGKSSICRFAIHCSSHTIIMFNKSNSQETTIQFPITLQAHILILKNFFVIWYFPHGYWLAVCLNCLFNKDNLSNCIWKSVFACCFHPRAAFCAEFRTFHAIFMKITQNVGFEGFGEKIANAGL